MDNDLPLIGYTFYPQRRYFLPLPVDVIGFNLRFSEEKEFFKDADCITPGRELQVTLGYAPIAITAIPLEELKVLLLREVAATWSVNAVTTIAALTKVQNWEREKAWRLFPGEKYQLCLYSKSKQKIECLTFLTFAAIEE